MIMNKLQIEDASAWKLYGQLLVFIFTLVLKAKTTFQHLLQV